MKTLLIEDEPDLLEEIARFLQEAGHLCEKTATFSEGQEKIPLSELNARIDTILRRRSFQGENLKRFEEICVNPKVPAFNCSPPP